MTNTFLNPSDKTASGTLSNGNLTFTSGTGSGVRTVDRLTSGRYYFEFTPTAWNSVQTVGGIGTAGTPLATAASSALGACIVQKSGSVYCNNATVQASLGGLGAGNVIGVAFDVAARLIWFRVAPSGNWNGNALYSPGGAGGVSFAVLGAGAVYGLIASNIANIDVITSNFGDSAFTGAVPSGFTAGFPLSSPPLTAINTQSALEQWSFPNSQSWVTQVALEEWGLTGAVGTQAIATQVALEEWARNPAVIPPGGGRQARVMVMA